MIYRKHPASADKSEGPIYGHRWLHVAIYNAIYMTIYIVIYGCIDSKSVFWSSGLVFWMSGLVFWRKHAQLR